jgi:hypothetical protein
MPFDIFEPILLTHPTLSKRFLLKPLADASPMSHCPAPCAPAAATPNPPSQITSSLPPSASSRFLTDFEDTLGKRDDSEVVREFRLILGRIVRADSLWQGAELELEFRKQLMASKRPSRTFSLTLTNFSPTTHKFS